MSWRHWACALSLTLGAGLWTRLALIPSFNTADTPLAEVEHARSTRPPAPALARRVLVVVVDGLGYEAAAALDPLADLRDAGAFRELRAEFPTFTSPAITSMVVGLGPRDSGVRLNGDHTGAAGLDSVLAAAWDEGVFVRVRARTYEPFARLVRPPPQADVLAGRWAFAADVALLDVVAPASGDDLRSTEITWVHLGEVDDAGHACGSTCEPYARAAAHAGETVANAARHLDPERDLLLVVSDHGTLPTGGHGGDEPGLEKAFLLAWGARVERGARLEPRPMRDLASTLSVAMGVHTPSSNLGEPMLDLWALDEAEAARRLAEPFEQTTRYACSQASAEVCATVGARLADLDSGRGTADARAVHGSIAREREDRLEREEHDGRWRRTALAFACVAASFIAAARWLSRYAWPVLRTAFVAPLPAAIAYSTVLFALGYRPTLSAMAGEATFVPHALLATVAGVIALVGVGRRLGWSEREAGFVMLSIGGAYVLVAARAGAEPKSLPSPLFGVLALQLAPLVGAASLGAAGLVSLRTGTEARSRPSSATTQRSAGRSGSECSDEDGCSRSRTGSSPG